MPSRTHVLGESGSATVAFEAGGDRIWLYRLFGLLCGVDGVETGDRRLAGPATSRADDALIEGDGFELVDSKLSKDSVSTSWQALDKRLRFESVWTLGPDTGVVSRKDRLINKGKKAVVIHRCLSRITLTPSQYEIYTQDSRWCREAQGRWIEKHSGTLTLGSKPGRFTDEGVPYFCVRPLGARHGLAFHVLPRANWTAHLHAPASMNGLPNLVIELGLSDRDLFHSLAPGDALELPEILVQELSGGDPEDAAPALHVHAQSQLAPSFAEPPVVYNTWFDLFGIVQPDRLRAQLSAAADLGCEVFVIDDGWFGTGVTDTTQKIGDWQERDRSAFRGQLKEFGDEVRAAGLGFGLWVEPEFAVEDAPVRQEHPEWFCGGARGRKRVDLENSRAAAWFRDEMCRVIESYELAWLKVDFNLHLGRDDTGKELAGYYDVLHRLWDEIRVRFPDTFIEGCSSGAMRLDLESLKMWDGHFPSDTLHPTDIVQICQGTMLRIPPGRLTRWLGVRSVGKSIPELCKTEEESAEGVIVPAGATWGVSEALPIDYAAAAAVPGIMGVSGDPASLMEESRVRLRWYIEFHKAWRARIRRSIGHLLTPPVPLKTPTGWTALQLQDPETMDSLLAVYHLVDGRIARMLQLRGLDPGASYTVKRHSPDGDTEVTTAVGRELMDPGVRIDLSCGFPETPVAGLYSVVRTA